MSLGMNDTQQCPSQGRLKSHLAHGERCPTCMPDEVFQARCPICFDRVAAQTGRILEHAVEGVDIICPGSGDSAAGRVLLP